MSAFNQKLALYTEVYNTEKFTSINYLAAGKLASSEELTTAVVQLYGNWSDRFPLYLSTKGRVGGTRKIGSLDTLFTVPIMGKPKKSSTVAKSIYVATDKIGVGKTDFYIYMADNWFKKSDVVETSKKNKLHLQEEGRLEGNYYKYTCRLVGGDVNAYITAAEIAPGMKLASMFAPAGLINSRGRESRSQSPARMQNQCAYLRKSYNWKGNVDNKVMAIKLPTKGGGTTTMWREWEMFQLELQMREEVENYLWYSEWNRTPDGQILDKDADTGEVMPLGSGLLEQIPNSSTYGVLTEEKLKRVMRDVFFNSSADNKREVTVYTGLGGLEEFDSALKKSAVLNGYQFNQSNKVIGGETNSSNLTYGAYFGTYRHVDGHVLNVKHLPLLDQGARAEAAPKHPFSGLPITSYDMYYIDESTIDGEPNIQFVCEKGREEKVAKMLGMNGGVEVISTDQDASSIQMAMSVGIHMYNPINSFKLTCNLS